MKRPLDWMFVGDAADYLREAYASGAQRGGSDARLGHDARTSYALRMGRAQTFSPKEQAFAVGYLVGYSIKVPPMDTTNELDSDVPA